MSHDNQSLPLLTDRRHFLRLSLMLGAASLSLTFPNLLMAATDDDDDALVLPARKPKAPRLLMIDPGHGGHDPGAIGISGLHEKDVTLDIGRRLANAIAARPACDAKLTRDADIFLPLEQRVQIGRDARADMFISIHADSAPNRAARGLSVYTLSDKATDSFSKALADHENQADLMGGVDVATNDKDVAAILFDLEAKHARNTAQHVRSNFVQSVGRGWRLLESPMRAANFAVLRSPDVPSMLVETGFLSNPLDEKSLRQPAEREKIARLMAKSLGTILESSLFG